MNINKEAKILIFDIENSPSTGYVWGKYQQDVMEFSQEWYMLSFAYKWYGEKRTKAFSLPDFSTYGVDKTNDFELVRELWNLFDEADIIIAHNGDRFDIRKANARFLFHGFQAPSAYRTVDTVKVARKNFMMNSNKLDDIGEYLGVGRKQHTGGFKLWLDCMAGDKKAWKKMVDYNKQDVTLLEDIYTELRPWMNNHPNINLVDERENACPTCGSCKLQKRGFQMTQVSKYQRYHCQDCGSWSKGKAVKHEVKIRA